MAGKANVDDSVIGRRLRPIYDWLDNGNNKKAAQEADKVLRKQPNLHCAKVLKALALLRLGKLDEGSVLITSVAEEGTADDATLQALTICYREMHQPDQICSIYEKAAKLDPRNEEIISHLFMAHVRVGDYKRQHQTALQLYKLKPKNPYYFWAVMSIVMQSHVSSDKTAQKISMQLAERMVDKFVSENKIDSEAEVLTYLYILESQEKYHEALQVLEGPLAQKIIQQPQNFIPIKKGLFHTLLKQYEASSAIYKELIQLEPDNWQHYVNFTKAIMSIDDKSPFESEHFLEASKFLKERREGALSDIDRQRCPHLGLLQFALVLKEKGLDDRISELCGDTMDYLYIYIKHYGDKMCCFGDIVNFLKLIEKVDRLSFIAKIEEVVHLNEDGFPVDIKNIHRHQISLQLKRAIGLQKSLTANENLQIADQLVSFYKHTAHLSADMVATDIKPNDTYLILATHNYFTCLSQLVGKITKFPPIEQKCLLDKVIEIFLRICCLLEDGINNSQANFQLKLLLIKAYNMIGATGASFIVYEKLDLKHIQLDTLGHILMFQSLDTGRHPLANSIFSNTLKFFMANYRDTADPLIMSYKFGSLVRIPEFVEFRNRLNNSLHFATVTTEQMLLELTTEANSSAELKEVIGQFDIDPSKDKTDWANLRDNRDLLVMNSWEQEDNVMRRQNSQLKSETFAADVSLLKLRSLSLRIVAAACLLAKPQLENHHANFKEKGIVNGDSSDTCDNIFNSLVQQLHQESDICNKYAKLKPPDIPIGGPDVPRIYSYSKGSYTLCFLKHTDLFFTVYNCTNGSEGLDSWSNNDLKEALETADLFISSHLTHVDNLEISPAEAVPGINKEPLMALWHFVQTFGLIVIILSCCNSLLAPIKSGIFKKNKKRKGNISLPQIIINFNDYIVSLLEKLHKFETRLEEKSLKHKTNGESVAKVKLLIKDLDITSVCESIEQSLCSSLSTLLTVFKSKINFLTALKL